MANDYFKVDATRPHEMNRFQPKYRFLSKLVCIPILTLFRCLPESLYQIWCSLEGKHSILVFLQHSRDLRIINKLFIIDANAWDVSINQAAPTSLAITLRTHPTLALSALALLMMSFRANKNNVPLH